MMNPARNLRRAARRAFTLVELLVAIGAIALIAVGLASVFGSVGDTVTTGRSVSAFTAYASAIERQLREDIAQMSREGFLLIVNQEAEGGADIGLFPGQPPPQRRPRRIDELLFFREGPFTSGREPVGAGYVARGNGAMIYYGHGARQPVNEDVRSAYVFPAANDDNSRAGRLGDDAGSTFGGLPNPNRYASEWGLLRLQVVLAGAGGATGDRPSIYQVPRDTPPLQDSDVQVAGQPAARSVFKTISRILPPAGGGAGFGGAGGGEPTLRKVARLNDDQFPDLASGLLDVVTAGFDDIRRGILSTPADSGAGGPLGSAQFKTPGDTIATADLDITEYDRLIAPYAVQQAWMLDALPAPSVGFRAGPGQSWTPGGLYDPRWQAALGGVRVRYEPATPAYLEPMDATQPLTQAVRLADQTALTSALLAPRCTEFIVEWSFGKVADDGRLIWHGRHRELDTDGDGADEYVARPYIDGQYRGQPTDDPRFLLPYRLREPAPTTTQFADEGDLFGSYPIRSQLIHGFPSGSPGDESATFGDVLVSFFGYMDPTFNPGDPTTFADDASASDSIPWAWPELIRITMSLADQSDPSVEQTFQFIFTAPGNPAP
ncbi:MAG: type II secretion system protein J [Phycisphaerales bacterium JB039]